MQIESLESYFDALKTFEGKTAIFRGIDAQYKKVPTIVRSFCRCSQINNDCGDLETFDNWYEGWNSKRKSNSEINTKFRDYESTLFDSFMRQSRVFLTTLPTTKWEWLAYAQHYGLRTRLLDWSKNPLAALYFAISNESIKSDVWVYSFDFGPLAEGQQHMIDLDAPPTPSPLGYTGRMNRFIPPIIDTRMAAQQSVFTIQEDPFEIVTDSNLTEFLIKGSSKEYIRKQLHRLAINQASLFPGVSGLTENLTWVWERYRGA